MSDAKHTPGPWRTTSSGEYVEQARPNGSGKMLAKVYLVLGPMSLEGKANARLIAMAPKLIELVRRAHQVALDRPHDGSQLDENLEELLLQCGDAIAKVEGQP